MTAPLAIYMHWPFCQSKCPYCDFNSFVAGDVDHAAWRAAYRRELEHYQRLLPDRRISSIFFGGGTPSLMAVETVADVLDTIARLWPMEAGAEITLEANPGSSEAAKFAGFRKAGINRLSLGVQALNDADLKFLGRKHSVAEARHAIDLASQHFPRFSFDLIYARLNQAHEAWEAELRQALTFAGDHLSLYQLTIEPNTTFSTRTARGELLTAEENPSVAMYELTQQVMQDAGRPAYEISNHAKPGEESRHNLTYWHYEDYIGIGPGAHGRIRAAQFPSRKREGAGEGREFATQVDTQKFGADADALRQASPPSPPPTPPASGRGAYRRYATDNHRSPETWLQQVAEQGQGLRLAEELDVDVAMREALMMGLRLVEGIDLRRWHDKFGLAIDSFLPAEKLRRLEEENYIARTAATLSATPQGLQRLNPLLLYLTAPNSG